LFGWGEKWKRKWPDRLTRLAKSIEAVGESDRRLIDDSVRVDRLRLRGAADLYGICSAFVGKVNGKLTEPAIVLDPESFSADDYNDGGSSWIAGSGSLSFTLSTKALQMRCNSTAPSRRSRST
jgi:hypothetical protein